MYTTTHYKVLQTGDKMTENNSQPADQETILRLLQVTRDKLNSLNAVSAELETLLLIEQEKTAKLQAELDRLVAASASTEQKSK
jgi:hypothetical protein